LAFEKSPGELFEKSRSSLIFSGAYTGSQGDALAGTYASFLFLFLLSGSDMKQFILVFVSLYKHRKTDRKIYVLDMKIYEL